MESIKGLLDNIEYVVVQLWQGKGGDIDLVSESVDALVNEISAHLEEMDAAGISFPMEYVSSASKNLIAAIEKKDDYLLADNLYYEWREILLVYEEVIDGIKGA